MKTHKEINKLIANLAGDAEVYDMKFIDRHFNGLLPEGKEWAKRTLIKTQEYDSYSTDLTLSIEAAKRIADKNNYTFVLTYLPEEGSWKASFGDYRNCAEYSGGNPAYCVCMSILQFMGKI